MTQHKFVFVCGLHRSGTSVLFRALRNHSLVSGFENTDSPENEGMHLQTVYKPSGYYGGAGSFGFNPEAHLTEASELITEANRVKLFEEWKPYWDLTRPILLEKSPPNLIRTRFLQAIFPDSYFVVVLRHPIAVSLATRAWYRRFRVNRRRMDKLIEHWLVCHELFIEDSKHLTNYTTLRYENFVDNPQETLDKIYSLIGVESHQNDEQIRKHINDKYFSEWSKMLDNPLTAMFPQIAIRRFEKRINQFGYSLTDL